MSDKDKRDTSKQSQYEPAIPAIVPDDRLGTKAVECAGTSLPALVVDVGKVVALSAATGPSAKGNGAELEDVGAEAGGGEAFGVSVDNGCVGVDGAGVEIDVAMDLLVDGEAGLIVGKGRGGVGSGGGGDGGGGGGGSSGGVAVAATEICEDEAVAGRDWGSVVV